MTDIVVIIPIKDPGADRYTAIKVQLRMLGVPVEAIPARHNGMTTLLMWMVSKPHYFDQRSASPKTFARWMVDNRVYVIHDVFSQSYLIRKTRPR